MDEPLFAGRGPRVDASLAAGSAGGDADAAAQLLQPPVVDVEHMTSSGPSWCRRNRRPLGLGCAALSPLTALTILVGSLASTPYAPDQPQPHHW